MSEWEEYKFSDFVTINPSVKLKRGAEHPFIEMKDLDGERKFCYPSSTRVTTSGSRFEEGDTLFARITPCLENGKICQVKGLNGLSGIGSTEFLVFRGKKGISDNDFVYYLSKWGEVRDFAERSFEGTSGRQRVPKNCFDNLLIKVPRLYEQKRIVHILDCLDNKINLLFSQNKTLDNLADTLFEGKISNYTNITFCPIGDIITMYDHERIPLSSIQRERMKNGALYPYYGAANIMDYVNSFLFDGEYILLGEDGSVETEEGFPILQMPIGKFWVNNHAHVFKANPPYSNYYIYTFLRKKNISSIITGAVQPKINQVALKSILFPVLPLDELSDLIVVINNLWTKIKANQLEIQLLMKLRDMVLPKLLRHELQVYE